MTRIDVGQSRTLDPALLSHNMNLWCRSALGPLTEFQASQRRRACQALVAYAVPQAKIKALAAKRGGVDVRLMSELAKALDAPLAWLDADG